MPTSATTYNKDGTLNAGIKTILMYGYPANTPSSSEIKSHYAGITAGQMQYATAAALCVQKAKEDGAPESVFKRYNATTSAIRAKSGNEIAFKFFQGLLAKAAEAATYTPQITSADGLEKNLYLNQEGNFVGELPITVNKCSEEYTWTVTPTTVQVTPHTFDAQNQISHTLSIAENQVPADRNMSITFSANDFSTTADIATYTNATATNSSIARVKRTTTPTPVSVTVKLIAVANTNTPFNIVKTDAADSTPVAGATISIYTASGTFVKSGQTTSQGYYNVTGLAPGSYYYQETAAPAGYELNSNKYNFVVLDNGSLQNGSATSLTNVKLNITNTPFNITKTDTATGAGVANAYIAIYDSSNNLKTQNKTDANGYMPVSGLKPGTYTYKETQAPTGYLLNSNTYTFTVGTTGAVTGDTTLPNTPSATPTTSPTGGINRAFYIEKVDTDTGATLTGALFSIYDSNSNSVFSGETNTSGRLLIPEKKLPQGTFTIYEDIAPSGYERSTNGTSVTVLSTGEVRGITNGVLTIKNKVSPTATTSPYGTGAYVQVYQKGTTTPVQNVQLTFTGGNQNFSSMSDANGKATFATLPNGSYSYKITQVPNTYASNTETYNCQKTGPNAATGTLIVYVDFVRVGFKKVDAKNESKTLAGAKFTLYDASFNEVTSVTTGDNGMAEFTKLNPGKYSVKETTAPKGYTPSNDSWSFEITNNYVNTAGTVVKNSGSVQTGVYSVYSNVFILALVAAVIIVYAILNLKRLGKGASEDKKMVNIAKSRGKGDNRKGEENPDTQNPNGKM